MNDREQALKWWETLDYDTKFHWFAEYCNRLTRNLEQIYDSEIEEIWVDNIKNSNIIRCPVCKSENVADISTYQSNGIYGPGSRSWKTSDMRSCEDCGVIFKPVKGNGL